MQDPFIGKRIEKCLIQKPIGRGGYGLTYLAYDEELREDHVIKISQATSEFTSKDRLTCFIEEGLILSRLKHPQIVTIRSQGEAFQHRYMILDYIHGYSLKTILDLIDEKQEIHNCAWEELLDPLTATGFILSALYPLAYAHQANVHLPEREVFGVAHRDIAPGNLILGNRGNEKGRIILIDFGTAKTEISEMFTTNQNLVGTVPYMGKARLQKATSAEQITGQHDFWREFKETQHDIHALGVLFFQLLTGKLPFEGESSPQIIVNILDPSRYTQCLQELQDFHPALLEIIKKCLVYQDFAQPQNIQPYQYPNAVAMLKDVEAVFQELSGGLLVEEVLTNFCNKISYPEKLIPQAYAKLPISYANPLPQSISIKEPTNRYKTLYLPISKKSMGIYISVLFFTALCFVAALYFYQMQKHQEQLLKKVVSPIEHLENLQNPSSEPNKPTAIAFQAKSMTKVFAENISKAEVKKNNSNTLKEKPIAYLDEINKAEFYRIESMVREEHPEAMMAVNNALQSHAELPDLLFFKGLLLYGQNHSSSEARQILAQIAALKPRFLHPAIFRENVLLLLWQIDLSLFEGLNTPESRIQLIKSSNIYISEFRELPAFASKVKAIEAKLPQ